MLAEHEIIWWYFRIPAILTVLLHCCLPPVDVCYLKQVDLTVSHWAAVWYWPLAQRLVNGGQWGSFFVSWNLKRLSLLESQSNNYRKMQKRTKWHKTTKRSNMNTKEAQHSEEKQKGYKEVLNDQTLIENYRRRAKWLQRDAEQLQRGTKPPSRDANSHWQMQNDYKAHTKRHKTTAETQNHHQVM